MGQQRQEGGKEKAGGGEKGSGQVGESTVREALPAQESQARATCRSRQVLSGRSERG